jgi:hypothetical protein
MNPEIILEPSALDKLHDLGGAKFVGEMISIFLDFVPKKNRGRAARGRHGQLAGCGAGGASFEILRGRRGRLGPPGTGHPP